MELSLGVPILREGPVTSQRPSGIGRKEQSEVRGVENKERATETGQARKGKGHGFQLGRSEKQREWTPALCCSPK